MSDVLRLTTYFGEASRSDGRLVADVLPELHASAAVRESLLLRGAAGFGRLGRIDSGGRGSLSSDGPVVSVAVDTQERIESVLGRVLLVEHRGVITLERARLVEGGRWPVGSAETKLTVFVGRRARAGGRPAYAAISALLHRAGLEGAVVLLGVDGTRDGRRARARFFHGNADVPTIVEGAGSSDAVGGLLAELASLVPEAPVMIEDVQICKRDGRVVAGPTELADTDPSGRPIWQKLTVHTSESTTHGGRAVHRELLDRLLAGDAAGATCIRGIWGFHDERAPHGDRLLQLRRRVPVVTTVIDRPSRIARSFEIVDGLTRESGLVTSQLVPALVAIGSDERIGGLELADLPGRPAG